MLPLGVTSEAIALEGAAVPRARLEASERRLRDMIEHAEDAILFLDRAGRITLFNQAAERLSGRRREDVIGAPLVAAGLLAPESTAAALAEFERVAAGEERPPFETTLLSAGGDRLTLEFHWRSVHEEGGTLVGVQGTGRDITGRKLAERHQARLQAALEKSAMEWRMTFDAMKSPILMLDVRGMVLRVNQAAQQLCGRSYLEMVERSVDTLGAEPPWRTMAALVALITESRSPEPLRTVDEGGGRTWEIEVSLIATPETEESRLLAVARDITYQVKLQESLRRSETLSAMGSLVAGVAHEVRNPLFGISATLDAVEQRFGERLEFQPYGKVLRGELNRLTGLMQELLDYGRPRALTIARGSIEPAIDRAITACAALAESAKVTVVKEPGGWENEVFLDADRLAQVFQNLIENSIQHSHAGGTVAVAARERRKGRRGWVDCTVADSGPGFKPEDLPRIFDPFFSRRRGGTGLGLSIVQRIVEQHGGRITARNLEDGGALMVVTLSAASPGAAAAPDPGDRQEVPWRG